MARGGVRGGLRGVPAAAALLAAAVARCAAQCPANAVVVQVAGQASTLSVAALPEGGYSLHNCSDVRTGYAGLIEVRCLGALLTARTDACAPRACQAGQRAAARTGAGNFLTAELVRALAHDGLDHVSCGRLVPGFAGHVRLVCRYGELLADASNCRPRVDGPSTMWRVTHADFLPGTWRVFELSLYTDPDCGGGRLAGAAFASSEIISGQDGLGGAFDGSRETSWAADCPRGCQPGAAWLGLALPMASEPVRCLRLLQSQVTCCGSPRVRLEVWDGEEWQVAQVWNTGGMRRLMYGFELKVPISCHSGKPEGTGVVHDCDGPPVVGRQEGESCTAKCAPGYFGEQVLYTCGEDGTFQGSGLSCYDVAATGRLGGLAGALVVVILAGAQYKFFCMYRKARLAEDEDSIPKALRGRWLEKGGTSLWETIFEEKKRELNRSVFDFASEGPAQAKDSAEAEKSKRRAGKKGKKEEDSAKQKEQEEAAVARAREEELLKLAGQGYHSLDGLCAPCEDPDICLTCVVCPMCRAADTWHTLGKPASLGYWRVYLAYALCPCCWPCLGFYGRLRVRRFFQIPLEPHRDCMVYCCCCCCCAPCAMCQEARLVDAPILYQRCYRRQQQMNTGEGTEV